MTPFGALVRTTNRARKFRNELAIGADRVLFNSLGNQRFLALAAARHRSPAILSQLSCMLGSLDISIDAARLHDLTWLRQSEMLAPPSCAADRIGSRSAIRYSWASSLQFAPYRSR